MSEINYQALREVAERAIPAMERLLMLPVDDDLLSEQELKDYGVDIDALNAFKFLTGPETVLALLDERERNQQYIKHRDQENEDIALTVGRLRVEMEAAEKRTAELESLAAPQLPQPAVVVSEAQSKKLFDEWSGGDGALGELRASGVPDEFISMLKEFSLATWEACREAMIKHSAPFIVTSDHRMMEMPAIHDIDAVAAMLQGAEPVSQTYKLPPLSSNEVNDAAWKLHNMLTEHGPLNGRQFNNLKGCFYEALKVAMRNYPVIPDSWISCSERMPDTKTAVLVAREFDRKGDWRMKWATYIPGHPDANDGWVIPGASWIPSHWMPLPEPPQEAK